MTLKQLEYFLEISKMGSVTRAAQNLNISQPPLSIQLKALEEELGVSLFLRDRRQLEITQEGKLLQERSQAILALVEETTRDLRAAAEERQVIIRISSIGSVNNRILPAKIVQFCRNYPHVSFRVMEGRTGVVLDNLAAGDADLGFVREPFNASMLRSLPIRDPALAGGERDYFVTVAQACFYRQPGATSIPLEDLRDQPLVTHRRYREMLVAACHKKGFSPHIICENDEIQSSLSWAAAGVGIAIAPFTSASQNTNPALITQRLESMTFSPQICLVWRQGEKLGPEAEAFIHLL